jgi:proteasome assembly chaperone (PAC2) family protein
MTIENLQIYKRPQLTEPKLLMGFSGWMDGGDVSTGTIEHLIGRLAAKRFACIEPEGFYIESFVGTMEMAALFRPSTRIEDGLVKSFMRADNSFYASTEENLILFVGQEPNINWGKYAEYVFTLCSEYHIRQIYFIGSVAGLVPHTREPKIFCSVSNEKLKDQYHQLGIGFSNYQGPAGIVTYLVKTAQERNIDMTSFVATVPIYIQGRNPKAIYSAARRICALLKIKIELEELEEAANVFENKLNELVEKQPELTEIIHKLEGDYDSEVFDSEMGDLKQWLQEKGIRID